MAPVVGAMLSVAVVAASCSSGSPGSPGSGSAGSGSPSTPAEPTTTTTRAGPYPVLTHTETLVDGGRPTPDLPETGVPPASDRTMVTTFTYPDGPGPFPLVAFAHGQDATPRKFEQLFAAWAAAGFVVVAPAFPLSNQDVPGAASILDLPSQPGDLSFVISSALRMNGEPGSVLQGKVDPEEIGVAGLSLGGATVYGITFDACCLDSRVDAAIVMDGVHPAIGGAFDLANGTPLLITHADGDYRLPYANAQEAFAAAVAPKYFVTIHEDVHFQPYEDAPDPADQMVIDTTTAFWRLYLGHDAAAAVDLSSSARVDGLTTVIENPG